MDAAVIGREREFQALAAFVEAVGQLPAAVLLEGEAGIGKTSLLRATVDLAPDRGFRVLSCRPGEAETKLAFSALRDLIGGSFDEVAEELPALQRRSLAVAMLQEEPKGAPPDRSVIGVGLLAVLRALAEASPVLIAVDDVQWIDRSSEAVLAFAARRVEALPVGILLTRRTTGRDLSPALRRALDELGVNRILLGPLSLGALHVLLRDRLRAPFPRPLLRRVHHASAGNPFFALEIARALGRQEATAQGGVLTVPEDLLRLLGARIDSLAPDTRADLLVAAASSDPTLDLLARVDGGSRGSEGSLRAAQEAGVVDVEGDRVRFTHPLLASTIYSAASASQRMQVHRALAAVVRDPEQRARHLALTTTEPDADVALALDEGARLAWARAAPDSAAELSELAARVTPPDDVEGVQRRALDAATYHFDSGDSIRAGELLRELSELSPPGPARADIFWRLADMSWNDIHTVKRYLIRGLADAAGHPAAECSMRWALAWAFLYGGELADFAREARTSLELAERTADPAQLAEALAAVGTCEFLRGRDASGFFARVVDLERSGSATTGYGAPLVTRGVWHMWAGEFEDARTTIQGVIDRYEAQGRYTLLHELYAYLGEIDCRAGRYEAAARSAAAAIEIRLEAGWEHPGGTMLYPTTLVEAHRGDVDAARAHAIEGMSLCEPVGNLLWANCHRAALGFLELSLGDHAAAHSHLEQVVRFLDEMGVHEHGMIPAIPDEIEALIGLGEVDEAADLLAGFDDRFCATGRPWALAASERCRGLLAGARGDSPEAEAAFDRALQQHPRVGQPLELGRTLLAKGAVARRARQKRSAREALNEALAIFDDIGAGAWAGTVRGELARIGGRPPSPGGLTPTELRIAELVSEGGSNREVAAALFVSVRTIETNLSRIYAKLGVRSRTALANRVLAGDMPVSNADPQGKP